MAEFLDTGAPLLPLGEILLRRRLVTPELLAAALEQQQRHGTRLGRWLTGEGHLSELALHHAIAEHYQLAFANLLDSPCEETLLTAAESANYLALEAIPWRREGERTLIATSDPSPALLTWAKAKYGAAHGFVITSPRDIRATVEAHFSDLLDHQSREALWETLPHQSAKRTLTEEQKQVLSVFLLALLACAWWWPERFALTALTILNLFYATTIGFKLLLFDAGNTALRRRKPPIPEIAEHTLPVYTVLVPLYREEKSLPGLLLALRGLDYPKSRLDIKLIVEADDTGTIEAIKALRPESIFQIVRVPYSLPQTKPKACNYALRFAKGDYVTIYDAEDRPDPQQLRKAAARFRHSPEDVVCLQARLNYYNRDDNLLTRLFSIEYSTWFDYMLPGLEALGIPIPLGGTSNHISLARLRELGEWDPYNVTEDADLGIRLASLKYRTGMVDSLTLEEAPVTLGGWLRQRSRWIKGYMQTWLVHMRHPVRLWRTLGWKGFWGFQFFIGAPCLVYLLGPVFWIFSLLWAAGVLLPGGLPLPPWLITLISINLFGGIIIHLLMAGIVLQDWRTPARTVLLTARKLAAGLIFPFYWLLHSLASFKSLWQLVLKPHFWEKTTHGLSTSSGIS